MVFKKSNSMCCRLIETLGGLCKIDWWIKNTSFFINTNRLVHGMRVISYLRSFHQLCTTNLPERENWASPLPHSEAASFGNLSKGFPELFFCFIWFSCLFCIFWAAPVAQKKKKKPSPSPSWIPIVYHTEKSGRLFRLKLRRPAARRTQHTQTRIDGIFLLYGRRARRRRVRSPGITRTHRPAHVKGGAGCHSTIRR